MAIPARRSPVRRIGLFGGFGAGNFGNDGSLEAVLPFLRRACPAAELLCICRVPTEVGPRLGIGAVRIDWKPERWLLQKLTHVPLRIPLEAGRWLQTMRHVRRLDLLLIPGTGILDDLGTGPGGMPRQLFRWCLLARIFGVKILFVSIGAGPISHPLSRWLLKSAARMAAYRSYRDQISKDFAESIGLDTRHASVYPDVVFGLSPPAPLREPCADGEPITVGVGIMSNTYWRADKARDDSAYHVYLRKMARFVRWLLDTGYRVRVLTGATTDQHPAETLCRMVQSGANKPDHPATYEHAYSPDDVLRQIADTDIVVATRFHNVVSALMLGRPTLSIGYADKNDVLLAEMGLGYFCQPIGQLDVDLLIKQFQKLAARRKVYEPTLRETSARFREALLHQEAQLADQYL